MQFQKISIPTPLKVIGNSEGEGGSKTMKLNWKFQGWREGGGGGGGGVQPKTFCGGYGYFLEQHNEILQCLGFRINCLRK